METAKESLEKRRQQLQVEIDEFAALRRSIAEDEAEEPDQKDMQVDEGGITVEAVAELRKLERQELDIRRSIARKRVAATDPEMSEEKLREFVEKAETLAVDIDAKRQKLEKAAAAHREKGASSGNAQQSH